MKFQTKVSLKKYTTFKIGGLAEYFFIAKTKKELITAVQTAKKLDLPFFVLGGGSNSLVSDKGYGGVIIIAQNKKIKAERIGIFSEAGTSLSKVVAEAAKKALGGMEWAAGIPGTVGGAVYGNAGAFGKSMKDVVDVVEVFDAKKNKIAEMKNKDCRFGYRQSVFKKKPHLVILSCRLKLKKRDRGEIKEECREYLDYRFSNHPTQPSAGSIFMNPKGFSARELIEACGLSGKKIGGAQISKKHPNFIINTGGATAEDVLKMVKLVKKEVDKKFKIKIKEEIVKIS